MTPDDEWQTSSYSGENGDCVQIKRTPNSVAARDSKDPDGPALAFSSDDFDAFLSAVKSGKFTV
jgi:hypothetical protein